MQVEAPMVKRPSPFDAGAPPPDGQDEGADAAAPVAYDASATMRAWERFVGAHREPAAGGLVRGLIERSWQRSARLGVDARGRGSAVVAGADEISGLRRRHREMVSAAGKTFERIAAVLQDTATMVVITDERGVIIETGGDPRTIDSGHDIRLELGANWGENVTGTNGIGTALVTGQPVYVRAAEHFCEGVKAWTCIGTPIRSPLTGAIIGVIDFSGPQDIFHRHNVALGLMAASHIELALAEEMRIEHARLLDLCLARLRGGERGDGFVVLDRFGRLIHRSPGAADRLRLPNGEGELRIGEQIVDFRSDPGADDPLNDGWRGRLVDEAIEGLAPERIEPLVIDGDFAGAMLMLGAPPRRTGAAGRPTGREAQRALDAARAAIIGDSEVLREAVDRAERAARGRTSILLEGETGVGKELFAQLIHAAGMTSGKEPFVAFNCGAVSRELLGSELFGHAPGAFTGATREGRAGRFEVAHGGVLSLDEIGEMPLDLQPYLLRVLEEKAVYRIGDSKARPIDVRLVASTNRNLKQEAAEGRFRKDLYFRLGAVRITIPALRQRPGDIGLLIDHFNHAYASSYGVDALRFRPEAIEVLERYSWPGNVRELRNLVDSLSLMSTGRLIGVRDLPEDVLDEAAALEAGIVAQVAEADEEPITRIDATERRLIEKALAACNGNTSLAAAQLGISRSTLYRKLQHYRDADGQAQGGDGSDGGKP
ncbi:sigma-54-dependent Fis family transcriptional regulator [Ancylobacter terrae]|uniref:sigma-54-dependent Fis family transcriptional regulator n=1 Tax=Ancylobacter sp. sgz301288 TaxID=3342077 RepID=UPI00385E8893